MRRAAIPAIQAKDQSVHQILQAMKENIEILNGVRGGPIATLGSDATLAQVVSKLNEVIDRLNAR